MMNKTTFSLFVLLVLATLCACAEQHEGGDSTTHWLTKCVDDSECGDLACSCGVCTSSCVGNDECVERGPGAVCAPSGTLSCSSSFGLCTVECVDDGDCSERGGATRCYTGRCVPPDAVTDVDAGGTGGTSGAGTGGSGAVDGGALTDAGDADGGGLQVDAGPSTTLRDGLAVSWALDGDGSDRSGNLWPLENELVPYAAGKFGQGLLFNGTQSGFVRQPTSTPALALANGDFTVSAWVSINTVQTYVWLVRSSVDDSGSGYPLWGIGFPFGGGRWVAVGASIQVVGQDLIGWAPGGFQHLLFEREGNALRFFVDGVLVVSSDMAKDSDVATASSRVVLAISEFQQGGFDGILDDVAIWTRVLTPDERAYLATHPVP